MYSLIHYFPSHHSKVDIADENVKQVELSQRKLQLQQISQAFIDRIISDEANTCMPFQLQYVAKTIGELAMEWKFEKIPLIGSFVLLRLLNPAVVFPDIKNITRTKINVKQRRNLVLISKVLQVCCVTCCNI